MTEADKIAAQISRADKAHEWAIAEAQKAVACEQRVTDLRIALNDIIALDHHWHGPEGRATEIARAALLRDDDTTMSNEREIGWLIERKYPTNSIGTTESRWYAERANGDHWWTTVPNDAKRFATKAEADAYPAYQMIASDHAISITEHVWIKGSTSSEGLTP